MCQPGCSKKVPLERAEKLEKPRPSQAQQPNGSGRAGLWIGKKET